MNKHLKTLSKKAGFEKEISTHDARRSFCTNHYYSGKPIIRIMLMTGHSSESEFLNYIGVSSEENARRVAANNKEYRHQEGLLKAI